MNETDHWCVVDTVDLCLLGNAEGVKIYRAATINGFPVDGETLARLAAVVLAEQLGWPLTRLRAVPYVAGLDPLVKRDEVTARISAEEAIARIEGRTR